MFVSQLPIFLDMVTLLFASFTVITSGLMLWLICKNENARFLIKRGNGGRHVRAIAIGTFLSGLSSLPYLIFSENYQSQICPFKWLHILACIRVFTLRIEITQLLLLSIERLIISLDLNTTKCRLLRRRLFFPSQIASVLIACTDVYMFARKEDNSDWRPSYSLDCTLVSVSNPVFMHWHFFLLNFISLALISAFLLAQHLFQPVQLINFSIRRKMARLSNLWLMAFCIALGIVFLLELANRFVPNFDANKIMRNYIDTIFHFLHLIYLPIFLRSVPWKSSGKIHTTSSLMNTVVVGPSM